MKFKYLLMVSVIGCTVLFVGCNKSKSSAETIQKVEVLEEISSEDGISQISAIGDIEVEKEIFDVTLTIPKEFVGEDITQEELNQKVEENGWKSAEINSDGSVTYVMSKRQHKEMMKEMQETIDEQLQNLCESEDYPNFVSIKAEDDYKKFTIVTKSEELDLSESFSKLVFYMYGGMYNIFNGTAPVDNVHVEFINEATGEIISSGDSKEMSESNE